MEEVAITPEQLQALGATNVSVDEHGQVVYTYVGGEEPAPIKTDHTAAEELLLDGTTEGQEVIIYDEATGQYQKCYYMPPDEAQPVETAGAPTEVVVSDEHQPPIDLQTLYESGAISQADYVALLGQGNEPHTETIISQLTEDVEDDNSSPGITDDSTVSVVTDLSGLEEAPSVPHQNEGAEVVRLVVPDGQEINLAEILQSQGLEGVGNHFLYQETEASPTTPQYYSPSVPVRLEPPPEKRSKPITSDKITWEQQMCTICSKLLTKKGFARHFKDSHADIRLGCPKCSQTYHSPELLNIHYKHYHVQEAVEGEDQQDEFVQRDDGRTTLKNVRLLMKCKSCQILVKDLHEHMMTNHASSDISIGTKDLRFSTIDCDICQKSYGTQREFANHRRRKGFCRPPVTAAPPQTRRVGILRKTL